MCWTYKGIIQSKYDKWMIIVCVDLREMSIKTYPGIIGYEWVWSSRRGTVRWERVWLADEWIVAFVIDPGVDEATVHAPGAVPCARQDQILRISKQITTMWLQQMTRYWWTNVCHNLLIQIKCCTFVLRKQPQSSKAFEFHHLKKSQESQNR